MVPVMGQPTGGQPVYLAAHPSPSGGNIITLPGGSPQHMVQALPPSPGGYVVQTNQVGQPVQYFVNNTPIIPMNALPQVAYAQPQLQPQVHFALAANVTPLTLWDVYNHPSSVRAANASYPIYTNNSAVDPPVSSMRLVCKDMPWMITIKKKDGAFVTIGDVFDAIYTQLQESIIHSEWRLMGPSTQKKVTARFQARMEQMKSQGKGDETRGIRRVDYLLGKTAFIGLKQDPKAINDLVGDIDIHNAWLLIVSERH